MTKKLFKNNFKHKKVAEKKLILVAKRNYLHHKSSKTAYAIQNPYWLGDTFVFRKDAELGSVYVKLNYENKIEEIGIDISKRMHSLKIDEIIKSERCKKASETQKTILESIGDEYWYSIRY